MPSIATHSTRDYERVTASVRFVKRTALLKSKQMKDTEESPRVINNFIQKHHFTSTSFQGKFSKLESDNGKDLKVFDLLQTQKPDEDVDSKAVVEQKAGNSYDSSDRSNEEKRITSETNSNSKGNEEEMSIKKTNSGSLQKPKIHKPSRFKVIRTKGQIEYIDRRNRKQPREQRNCLFVGNLPQEVKGLELAHLFGEEGPVHSVRRMMENSFLDKSKPLAFVTFISKADARKAKERFHGYEIRKRMNLIVQEAFESNVLFVGNVSKYKSKEQLHREFSLVINGLKNVIVYKSMSGHNNRGFCFLEFGSHKEAYYAKNFLVKCNPGLKHPLFIDWADDLQEPEDDVMETVKRVHISNLPWMTQPIAIYKLFKPFGIVERVKNIQNYAFVHFEKRLSALLAIDKMNNAVVDGEVIKVTLSKPPINSDTKKEVLEKRERRLNLQKKKDLVSTTNFQNKNSEQKLAWYMNPRSLRQSSLYAFYYMNPPRYQRCSTLYSPTNSQHHGLPLYQNRVVNSELISYNA